MHSSDGGLHALPKPRASPWDGDERSIRGGLKGRARRPAGTPAVPGGLRPRLGRFSPEQPLQEDAGLVGVFLEGVGGASRVLVAPGLVESQRVGVAGPGGEPEDFRAMRRGQGLRPGEQLLADAAPQEGTLNVEAAQLGGLGFRRYEGVGLAVGELREAQQVIRQLGDQEAAPRIGEESRERLLGEQLPGFPRDRRPDTLRGVSIEKDLRCQDAQGQDVALDGHPAGDLGAMFQGLHIQPAVGIRRRGQAYGGLDSVTTAQISFRRSVAGLSRPP